MQVTVATAHLLHALYQLILTGETGTLPMGLTEMVSKTMYNGGRRTQKIPPKKKEAPLQVIAFKNGKYSSEVQIPHNCSKKYSTL